MVRGGASPTLGFITEPKLTNGYTERFCLAGLVCSLWEKKALWFPYRICFHERLLLLAGARKKHSCMEGVFFL